jgi:hypothetical protein
VMELAGVHTIVVGIVSIGAEVVSITARVHMHRKDVGMALAFVRPRPSPSREARSSAIIIRAGTCPGHLRLLRGRTVV